jgi:hypothetical protein
MAWRDSSQGPALAGIPTVSHSCAATRRGFASHQTAARRRTPADPKQMITMPMPATKCHLPGVTAPALKHLRSTLEARMALTLHALRRRVTPLQQPFASPKQQDINVNKPSSGCTAARHQGSRIALPRRIG